MKPRFCITEDELSYTEISSYVRHPRAGAVVCFEGVVRDLNEGNSVSALEYQSYEEMALKQLESIALEIESEIEGVVLAGHHRVGMLKVSDIAVLVCASSMHRDEAFRAAKLFIDRIKADLPIWKREFDASGNAYWIGWKDARCGHLDHQRKAQ